MSYIIDLTLILQNVFWLQVLTNQGRPLSRRLIKAAASGYHTSNTKQTLRFKIDQHVQTPSLNVGPDITLKKIIELIEECTIDSAEMLEQRASLSSTFSGPGIVGADEEWEVDER